MKPIELPDGRWVVPGNRWDLVPTPPAPPTVSVVIPYYSQQRQLALVLEALALQTYPAAMMQVVIADDGSPTPPDVDDFRDRLDITVVRQRDLGFRAAAARNLGAAASDGSVLCFLDADTVPEPRYVDQAVRLPAALPDALVVGRRRHANLEGWSSDDVRAWFSGDGVAPDELTEPGWLIDGYAASRDLLDVDRRSYRYIISAVATCSREIFDSVGGFDETFVQYGGEDWDFAHRAFDAGAVFAHARAAVAWHDGPEWSERTVEHAAEKNSEALALSARITDPAARTHGLIYPTAQITASVDSTGHSAASLLVTVGGLLSGSDCAVWIHGEDAAELRGQWGDADPRVRIGQPTNTRNSRFVIDVSGLVRFAPGSLQKLVGEAELTGIERMSIDAGLGAAVSITSSRSEARAYRWAKMLDAAPLVLADQLFGHSRRAGAEFGISTGVRNPPLSW